jgi:hypothetical protein
MKKDKILIQLNSIKIMSISLVLKIHLLLYKIKVEGYHIKE